MDQHPYYDDVTAVVSAVCLACTVFAIWLTIATCRILGHYRYEREMRRISRDEIRNSADDSTPLTDLERSAWRVLRRRTRL